MVPEAGDPFAAGLGGTEQALIHLTAALAARGHGVRVAGGCAVARDIERVRWTPEPAGAADVTVAVNDARLLGARPGLPVVWFHNEVELGREWRKGRMLALWRHRPVAVFIGSEQARLASRLIGLRARVVIPYGLPPRILAGLPAEAPPPPHAVFTSQAYRGLRQVIGMWRKEISPEVRGTRLTAYVADGDVAPFSALAAADASISVRARIGNAAMAEVLRGTRVLLAPGHRSETFCLAAAESVASGVPVVTLGVGALKERVISGQTGFVCRGWPGFAKRTRDVLTDDTLWRHLQTGGLATRASQGWDRAAAAWEMMADEHGDDGDE